MATKKMEKSVEATQVTEQPDVQVSFAPANPVLKADALETLDELAQRHRVPAWQLGALLRYMDWEPDKQATDAEFVGALGLLSGRPLGGGRR